MTLKIRKSYIYVCVCVCVFVCVSACVEINNKKRNFKLIYGEMKDVLVKHAVSC